MLKLEIVTPERKVVDVQADSVTVPTASGDAGILPQHAPLVSALRPGVLTYTVGANAERVAIAGGFVEVNADRVSVLADSAETADEIDPAAARAQREVAEQSLAAAINQPIEETEHLRDEVAVANAKLQIAGSR
ncbi:MAG TPA: ATP synthase F1 subunit epsilon [Pyrinomonadaceae bacterium]|jgi:F-type H+-transporting ATPase subunit epsilon|nr:ATP synthase F1 subunit epsilon [Pyrinomonadaceae bacterium]